MKTAVLLSLLLAGCWQQSNVSVTNNHATERQVSAHLTVHETAAADMVVLPEADGGVDPWITKGATNIAPNCAPFYQVVEACLGQAHASEMSSAAYRSAVSLKDEELRWLQSEELMNYDYEFSRLLVEGDAVCTTPVFVEEHWIEAQALRARVVSADQTPSAACDMAVGQMPRRGAM